MKIYSHPLSFYGAKVLIAAAEKGIDLEVELLDFTFGATQPYGRHPEVDRINPKRQVPVLIDGPLEIFDSTVICEYLEDLRPDRPLWPSTLRDRALARFLEMKIDEIWFMSVLRLRELPTASPEAAAVIRQGVTDIFGELEARLGGRDYLVAAYSYVDIGAYLTVLFAALMGQSLGDRYPQLSAWRRRVGARPAVAKVTGGMVAFARAGQPAVATA